jgi:hypothetical protein
MIYTKQTIKSDAKLVATVVVAGLVLYLIMGVAMAVSKPTNCAISKDNPYSSMPMVCKVVLKIP